MIDLTDARAHGSYTHSSQFVGQCKEKYLGNNHPLLPAIASYIPYYVVECTYDNLNIPCLPI